jgi:hypothetical protein
MTDAADRLGYWAKQPKPAGPGLGPTSNNSANPDHSEGPVVHGQLDPDKPYPWGGTIQEQDAAHQARYGIPIGFGPINGEAKHRDLSALFAKLGWTGPATLTDLYDLQVVDGLAEAVDAAVGAATDPVHPVPTPAPALPPSPPTSPPAPTFPAASADAHGAAVAYWGKLWPVVRPALVATHGVVVGPSVRQAFLAGIYPLLLAAAQAGTIAADGSIVA